MKGMGSCSTTCTRIGSIVLALSTQAHIYCTGKARAVLLPVNYQT